MGYVLALVDNLFFQARIQAVAKQIGVEVKVIPTGDVLVTEALANPPTLVIIDLNARSGALETIRQLRAGNTTALVLGYMAHTQTELAQQAEAAGCERVLPQGRFTQELPMILAKARGKVASKNTP